MLGEHCLQHVKHTKMLGHRIRAGGTLSSICEARRDAREMLSPNELSYTKTSIEYGMSNLQWTQRTMVFML